MKKIICEGEEHILLTKEEYSNMTPKTQNFILCEIPVVVRFPLPNLTCSNWEQWKGDNSGIIYKGVPIKYDTLKRLRDTAECKEKTFSKFAEIKVTFDGLPVNISEIDTILNAIDEEWQRQRDNPYSMRIKFTTYSPCIITKK